MPLRKTIFDLPFIHHDSVIPQGCYCYTTGEMQNINHPELGNINIPKITKCVYWDYNEDNHEAYCHYLKEYDFLLLSDQCKICGINMDDPEEDVE